MWAEPQETGAVPGQSGSTGGMLSFVRPCGRGCLPRGTVAAAFPSWTGRRPSGAVRRRIVRPRGCRRVRTVRVFPTLPEPDFRRGRAADRKPDAGVGGACRYAAEAVKRNEAAKGRERRWRKGRGSRPFGKNLRRPKIGAERVSRLARQIRFPAGNRVAVGICRPQGPLSPFPRGTGRWPDAGRARTVWAGLRPRLRG